MITSEFERDVDLVKITEVEDPDTRDTQYDECMLAAIVSGLVRQQSYKFLEHLNSNRLHVLRTSSRMWSSASLT